MAKQFRGNFTLIGIFLLAFTLAGFGIWRADAHTAWAGGSYPTVEMDGELFYIVRSGNTVSELAEAFGVSEEELLAVNDLEPDTELRTGQRLRIPESSDIDTAPAFAELIPAQEETVEERVPPMGIARPPAPVDEDGFYIVVRGDTLRRIEVVTGVAAEDIVRYNNLQPGKPFYRGQRLRLAPGEANAGAPDTSDTNTSDTNTSDTSALAAQTEPATAPRTQEYTIQRGDSLQRIARLFNVEIDDIVAANNLNPRAPFYPGQVLRIPTQDDASPTQSPDLDAEMTNGDETLEEGLLESEVPEEQDMENGVIGSPEDDEVNGDEVNGDAPPGSKGAEPEDVLDDDVLNGDVLNDEDVNGEDVNGDTPDSDVLDDDMSDSDLLGDDTDNGMNDEDGNGENGNGEDAQDMGENGVITEEMDVESIDEDAIDGEGTEEEATEEEAIEEEIEDVEDITEEEIGTEAGFDPRVAHDLWQEQATDARIHVFSPAPDSAYHSQLEIIGLSQTFEGNVEMQLIGENDEILAERYATGGSVDGYDFFRTHLRFTVQEPISATLVVFERSAKDGSMVEEVEIPLSLLPGQRFIDIYQPEVGANLCNTVLVAGYSNTFEANVSLELTDPAGDVLTTAYTMGGAYGIYREFFHVFDYSSDEPLPMLITAYEEDASDRFGRIDPLTVPVTYFPGDDPECQF